MTLPTDTPRRTGWEWPAGIALGLLAVVLVNFAFVYVAASDMPDIDPSYETGRR